MIAIPGSSFTVAALAPLASPDSDPPASARPDPARVRVRWHREFRSNAGFPARRSVPVTVALLVRDGAAGPGWAAGLPYPAT